MKSIFAIIALAILLPVFPATVSAHFTEPVPTGWDDWAMRQFNLVGNRCCDPSDVFLFKAAWRYEYDEAGRISGATLTFENGMEVYVGKNQFVDRERNPNDINPTGTAVVWYRDITNLYCFDPPGALG